MDIEILQKLIEAGIRAPTGDNCQPQRFKIVGSDQIRITIDQAAAKSFFDYNHAGTLFSLGCVVENMRLQAAHEGVVIEYGDLSDLKADAPEINIKVTPAKKVTVNLDLIHAMHHRTMNRRPYSIASISDEIKTYLLSEQNTDISLSSTDVVTHWYDSRKSIGEWADIICMADKIRYSHEQIHNEVFGKILLSKKEADVKRIGLEIDRLGIGPMAKFVIMLLRPWERMKKLSKLGVDTMLSLQSKFTAKMSGAIVVVTIPKNAPKYWVEAGMKAEKNWVLCQQRQLSVQPMTVAFFLNQRFKAEGLENFYPHHQPIISGINQRLKQMLPECEGAMLFRVGKGPMMKGPTIRQRYQAFIKKQRK